VLSVQSNYIPTGVDELDSMCQHDQLV
jgi:hypothetical protein